mmetsp:Transcript_17385/g.36090  ORF Transcript_17385/g.36090 Transcript_17385/m.36090 type:complete len:103 (-) Transcript_17385:353-661(-)
MSSRISVSNLEPSNTIFREPSDDRTFSFHVLVEMAATGTVGCAGESPLHRTTWRALTLCCFTGRPLFLESPKSVVVKFGVCNVVGFCGYLDNCDPQRYIPLR